MPDVRDAVAYREIRQAAAERKLIVADTGDAIGDHHASQTGAIIESSLPDACNAVGDGDGGKPEAEFKGLVSDAGDAAGNRQHSLGWCTF